MTSNIRLPLGSLQLKRRSALLGLGSAFALGNVGIALANAPTNARFVVINIRGGLDGLAAVAPYGDPTLAKLRAPLMAPSVGTQGGMLYLGGFFGLHPSLVNLHAMYAAGQALVVHAVGNCALTRSHFEGQDYLQSGAPQLLSSGWLNRVASFMPAAGGSLQTGIAVDSTTPLLLRGPTVVAGWGPDGFAPVSSTLASELLAVTQPDPLIGPALQTGYQDRTQINAIFQAGSKAPTGLSALQNLAWGAGQLLAAPGGPRIAALETVGVDTHFGQVDELDTSLSDLDGAIGALQVSLGSAWKNTVVLTMTEFGRTAAVNGTNGTDHGTGFAVFMAGGAVAGGKVVTTWPGLSPSQLYQGRDLAPTVDFRSVAMTVLQQHLGVPASAIPTIFPGATGLSTMSGLVNG
jgi:uncharacterized protein (DUF1501 family)